MKALLLVPHADDETLFATHIVMRYYPAIKIVFMPEPEIEHQTRREELTRALRHMGVDQHEWLGGYEGQEMLSLRDRLQEWVPPHRFIDRLANATYYDHVFAPCPEVDGHREHTYVGQAALDAFGPGNVTLYHTYTRSGGRVRRDNEVELPGWMVAQKLRALSEYRSQIDHPDRRPWFTSMLDLREWFV